MKEYSILLEETPLTEKMIEGVLDRIIEQIDDVEKILLVPPDITRCYSGGGKLQHICIGSFRKGQRCLLCRRWGLIVR